MNPTTKDEIYPIYLNKKAKRTLQCPFCFFVDNADSV